MPSLLQVLLSGEVLGGACQTVLWTLCAWCPLAVLGGWAVSYERGTPVSVGGGGGWWGGKQTGRGEHAARRRLDVGDEATGGHSKWLGRKRVGWRLAGRGCVFELMEGWVNLRVGLEWD